MGGSKNPTLGGEFCRARGALFESFLFLKVSGFCLRVFSWVALRCFWRGFKERFIFYIGVFWLLSKVRRFWFSRWISGGFSSSFILACKFSGGDSLSSRGDCAVQQRGRLNAGGLRGCSWLSAVCVKRSWAAKDWAAKVKETGLDFFQQQKL